MFQKKQNYCQRGLPECFSVLMLFLDLHFTRADAPEAPGAERDDTNWRGRFSHPPVLNCRSIWTNYNYKKTLQIYIITHTYTNQRGHFSHPPFSTQEIPAMDGWPPVWYLAGTSHGKCHGYISMVKVERDLRVLGDSGWNALIQLNGIDTIQLPLPNF